MRLIDPFTFFKQYKENLNLSKSYATISDTVINVIKCKDCNNYCTKTEIKYCNYWNRPTSENDFCSHAKGK